MSESASYTTIDIPVNSDTTISGSNDTIDAGADSILYVTGANNTLNFSGPGDVTNIYSVNSTEVFENSGGINIYGSGLLVELWGSDDMISGPAYNTIVLESGADDTVSMYNGSLVLGAGVTGAQLNGYGDIIDGSNDDVIGIDGDYDTVNLTSSNVIYETGSQNTLNLNGAGNVEDIYAGGLTYIFGSSDDINIYDPNVSIDLWGSNDFIGVASSNNTISLESGSGDTVDLYDGTLIIQGGIVGVTLNGSGDIVDGSSTDVLSVDGDYDTVNLVSDNVVYESGTQNTLNLNGSGNTEDLYVAGLTYIYGSSEYINIYDESDAIDLWGSNNTITEDSYNTISIESGTNNIVNMYSGLLTVQQSDTTVDLNGSGNVIDGLSSDVIGVYGEYNTVNLISNNVIYLTGFQNILNFSGSGNTVDLYAGTSATINGSSNVIYLLDQGAGATLTLAGSSNTIYAGTNDSLTLGNSANVLNMSGGTVTLATGVYATIIGADDNIYGNNVTVYTASAINSAISGNGDTVQFGGGTAESIYLYGVSDLVYTSVAGDTVYLTAGTSAQVVGSSANIDFVDGGAGASAVVTGSNDVINAGVGDTLELSAGDSGDVVNMIGGTVVLDANLSNITINGTGDVLEGADAGDAGINYNSYINHVEAGGVIVTDTIHNTFAIQYSSGNIQDIVNYFEANPNLSENAIVAAESDSDYQSNLQTYLYSADIYGGSSPIPPNVVAMLEGYSSTYAALLGVNTSILAEETYIESQFAWGGNNAPVPDDGLVSMLQNLTPALEDTNGATELDVTDALACLQDASGSGTSQGNVVVMDTAAKLLLEMAEQPDDDKSPPLTDPNYINLPGLTGPYAITVQPGQPFGDAGTNELINLKNEDGGAWGEFVNDFEAYGGPILDIAAIIIANPALIGLTIAEIPAAVAIPIEVASTAYNLAQGGEAISQGNDVAGAFAVLSAIGSGLEDIGGSLATIGSILASGVSVVQGAYDFSIAVQEGNILDDLSSALESASGVAGLNGDTTLQNFALLGEGLSNAAENGEAGDVSDALISLVQSASAFQQLGGISGIEMDFDSMFAAFTGAISSTPQGVSALDSAVTSASATPNQSALDYYITATIAQYEGLPSQPLNQIYVQGAGPTIGWGVDLNQQTASGLTTDLEALGETPAQATAIVNFVRPWTIGGALNPNGGLTGTAASNSIAATPSNQPYLNNLSNLTVSDAILLSEATAVPYIQWVQANMANSIGLSPPYANQNEFVSADILAQVVELHYSGNLIATLPKGATQSQIVRNNLFNDIIDGNWTNAANDIETLVQGHLVNTSANVLNSIAQKLLIDNGITTQ